MPEAPLPENEARRLAAVHALKLLDTPPEERFDRISRLARRALNVTVAYVALIDGERQWFKSICGVEADSVPRRASMCSHTIHAGEPIFCPDTLQEGRFADNPNVINPPHIRLYMGFPLKTPEGLAVGTFCCMGTEPRELSSQEIDTFLDLAQWAQNEINLIDVLHLQKSLHEANEQLEKRNGFIRNVLGRFLTDQVAEQLLEHPEGLRLGGELRDVSVLMSDLRGFTPMSERSTPEQVVGLLNRYLECMTEVIDRHGGTIDEFIGDAILVIFGAPLGCADHARRATACALEMQLAMEQFNAESRERGMTELQMGIAVNTGTVVVGNIGSVRRMKYGVVGSPVNLCARIQAFSLGGQVLVSHSTLTELGAGARVDGHLRVKVKGVDEPVCIYEVGGLESGPQLALPGHLRPAGV